MTFTEYCKNYCDNDWMFAHKNIAKRSKSGYDYYVQLTNNRDKERRKYNVMWRKYNVALINPRVHTDDLEQMQKEINAQGAVCDNIEMQYNARHLRRAMAYNAISSVLKIIKTDAMMNGLTEEELTFLDAPAEYAQRLYTMYPKEVSEEERNGWITERDTDCDSEYSDEEHYCKVCNKVRTPETNTNNKTCIKCLRKRGFKGVHYDRKVWKKFYEKL